MTNSQGGKAPNRGAMITAMAEAIIPGLTGSLPQHTGEDARTTRLLELLARPEGSAPADGILADEMTTWTGSTPPIVGRYDSIDILAPTDAWAMGATPQEGTLVRYYLKAGALETELTVGWTEDDRIYYLG